MDNPMIEGNYTTIFKDGSIILENPWLMFPDGHGKWYWNEYARGGVIHWFKPEEPYKVHCQYELPDWELIDLVEASIKYAILTDHINLETRMSLFNDYLKNTKYNDISEVINDELKYYEKYKKNYS